MNSETDHTTFSVTGLRTLIQHREEELKNMPEQIRVRLARGADQLQLSEWETEKRGRLRQEIGEMQTRIAARYRQAGIPIPAPDKGGDNITSTPTAPTWEEPTVKLLRERDQAQSATRLPQPTVTAVEPITTSEEDDGAQLLLAAIDKANRRRRAQA